MTIHDWQMALYWRLPAPVQERLIDLYAAHLDRLYYGPGYPAALAEFTELQHSSSAAAAGWQNERLAALVGVAGERVPFYRKFWRHRDWRSVRDAADLHKLPLLEKQRLRQNEREFLAEGTPRQSLWLEKTSGTTGTALRIYWPRAMLPRWWALVEISIRKVAGVGQEVPRAMMGGRNVVHGSQSEPPYWRFNARWQQLYLSSYHVSKRTAADYAAALRRYGSRWITGYGSAIAALAQSALEARIAPVPMQAVIVSGDTLLPGMRRSIETFFQCKCYDSYGQCEAVCMAMECRDGRLHVIPAAGIWEILREDGTRCAPGEVGEIVATGLLNDAMPLIRYRMGDYAAWASDQHCGCGNPQPIITRLEGRIDDYLITRDGKKIGRLAAFKRSPAIHSAQVVQDRPAHAYLLVRPGAGYSRADAEAVRSDIVARIGGFDIEIIEVAEIPKTASGKTRSVVRLDSGAELPAAYEEILARHRAPVKPSRPNVQKAQELSSRQTLNLEP